LCQHCITSAPWHDMYLEKEAKLQCQHSNTVCKLWQSVNSAWRCTPCSPLDSWCELVSCKTQFVQ